MKKVFIIISLFVIIFGTTSCSNDFVTYENEIKLRIPEEYSSLLKASDIPDYTLTFDGKINVSSKVDNNNEICFVNNDDFFISGVIENLLKEYEEKDLVRYITLSEKETASTRMNRLINKDGKDVQKSEIMNVVGDKIINKVAYISLLNGLSLSINFRTFESDHEGSVKTYYTWQYEASSRLYLHYPLFTNHNNDGCQLIIVPLPVGVNYAIGLNINFDKLTSSNSYDSEEYRRFRYFGYNDEKVDLLFDLNKAKSDVIYYYETLFNANVNDDIIEFEYLGNNFIVTLKEAYFEIKCLDL